MPVAQQPTILTCRDAASGTRHLSAPQARTFERFVPGTYDKIAVFGPESRMRAFLEECGMSTDAALPLSNADELRALSLSIPVVLLPMWWQSRASPEVISAARDTGRQILAGYTT